MPYSINSGISISLDNAVWYSLTDHNRQPITVTPSIIEHAQRMANGKMRKYVVATKKTVSTSWTNLPSKTESTVDGNYSSAWLAEFYNANVFLPVYVKFTHSTDTTPTTGSLPNDSTFGTARTSSEVIKCFITKFDIITKHRNVNFDYVDMNIEFTEI